MINFLLILHFIVTMLLVGIILLQKSEGGGLGVGNGTAGLITVRGAANLLTRTTSVLAVIFMANCLLIGALVSRSNINKSILVDGATERKFDYDPLLNSQSMTAAPASKDSSGTLPDNTASEEACDMPNTETSLPSTATETVKS